MENGPKDPALWLNREAGSFESEMIGPSDTSSENILLNTWIKADKIDPIKMEEAYRALIYNQPNFRAKIVKHEDGILYFRPATDFSDVFEFMDQSSDDKCLGYDGCWTLAESLANTPFKILNTPTPPHKCYLIKRPDGYNLFFRLHHSISDGTSTFRMLNEVLKQYDLLISGKPAELCPAEVLPPAEVLSVHTDNKELVKQMVEERVARARDQKIFLPLNKNELSDKCRTFPATGTSEGFSKMKALCKKLGITVGAYSFAVLALAKSAVYIRRNGNQIPPDGIPTIYTDILVNLRDHLVPSPGECFMLYIAYPGVVNTIGKNSSLFDTSRDMYEKVQSVLKNGRLSYFFTAKKELITGEHSKFFNSLPEGTLAEFTPSNQGLYKHQTKFDWGEVMTSHTLGGPWCPHAANQVVLYQCVNGAMCYSLVCCEGDDNIRDAKEVFDLFVYVMENSDLVNDKTGLMDLVDFDSKAKWSQELNSASVKVNLSMVVLICV